MSHPHRIQRRRSKGWQMPEGAIYVGRPTVWGNPFIHADPAVAAAVYRKLISEPVRLSDLPDGLQPARNFNHMPLRWDFPEWAEINISQLAGKNLACWCPILKNGEYHPCHADVLLARANGMTMREVIEANQKMAVPA